MTTDLRALVEKATPGPWRFVDPSVEDCEIAAGVERVMAGGYTEGGSINKPVKQADIDLIVAAVNALPGLLDKIDELQAALDAQAGGWLPIESAPRDGMSRLYLYRGKVVQGFVDATGQLTVQHEFGWRAMRRKPTHWMPLPAGPVEGGQ